MKKEKKLNLYQTYDQDEGYVQFFVARSPGEARYAFCNEVGIMFEETFDVIKISVVPKMQKYIDGNSSGYNVDLFSDEYWLKALYAEGGSFTNGNCESDNDDELSLSEMLDRECRHRDGTKCEYWDDERIWINIPKNECKIKK